MNLRQFFMIQIALVFILIEVLELELLCHSAEENWRFFYKILFSHQGATAI